MGRNQRKKWQGKPCVLCGGNRLAETIEHAPPIIMFRDQQRPAGLEVPACKRCNNGTSELDQVATFLALSQAPQAVLGSNGLSDYELKVTKGTANNSPELYSRVRSVPVCDALGRVVRTAREVELAKETSEKIALWSAKQSLALWFQHTGKIASHRSTIDVEILTNAKRPSDTLERVIREMGNSRSLSTSRNVTSEQFCYKVSVDPNGSFAIIFAQYHGGFAFVSVVKDCATAKLSRKGLQFKVATNAHRGLHLLPM